MARGREVRIGERFKSAPNGGIFEVGSISVEGCLVPHAKLFNIKYPTEKKFISVNALRDANLYVPVENPDLQPANGSAE